MTGPYRGTRHEIRNDRGDLLGNLLGRLLGGTCIRSDSLMAYFLDAECVCMPGLGFICKNCEERNKPEEIEKELKRQGYGYSLADQDGHDGGEVSAIEHKEEEFFFAAEQLFEAKEIEI